MRISEKAYNRNNEFNKRNYDQINIRANKEERIIERVQIAAIKHNETSAKYIRRAIIEALERDNVTVDSLPDRAESVKQD